MVEARRSDEELAKGDLRGHLHGVPMTIKDALDTAGVISSGGTQGRSSFVPEQDAHRWWPACRAAGAILLGKTNTPELTLGFETVNLVYGRTNNPYDVSRTCGGSSGGAAAIIAAGGIPFDIGSDTGGAFVCHRTFAAQPAFDPRPDGFRDRPHSSPCRLDESLTQIGPMARYVEDLITILPIIAGVDWRDPAIVPMPLADPNQVNLTDLRAAFYTDNGIVTPRRKLWPPWKQPHPLWKKPGQP